MPFNKDILGWMLIPDLNAIEKIAQLVPENGTIVEVGAMYGRSSVCWAMSTKPSTKIYCIDIFYENYLQTHPIHEDICRTYSFPISGVYYDAKQIFLDNTKEFLNINMIQGNSPEDISFNNDIDIFFLDASHQNPSDWKNICYFGSKIKAGGIICGHDYEPGYPDVVENVTKLEAIIGKKVTTYSDSSIWSFIIDKPLVIDKF